MPQGKHVHGLLARGLEEMERLFPGVTAELAADGGEISDPGIDLHWNAAGARKPPAGIGNGISCTRPFLEAHLRRRLTALPADTLVRGRVKCLTASVWMLSTTADFRLSHVTGDRRKGLWLTHRLNDLYTRATLRDADMHQLFLQVLNLQVRPEALARPDHFVPAWESIPPASFRVRPTRWLTSVC